MRKVLVGCMLVLGLAAAALAAEEGWVSLFDGKTLTGWTQKNGTAPYTVENGTIVGRTAKGSPNSFLCTDKEYGDFELEFDVKVDEGLNSGVQLRSKTKTEADGSGAGKQATAGKAKAKAKKGQGKGEGKGKANGKAKGEAKKANPNDAVGRVFGPQVEIASGGEQGSLSGYIYGEAMGDWRTPKERLVAHKHLKDGDWNHFRVVCRGPRIETWINGEKIEDLTDEAIYKTHPKGFISLQVHGIGAKELAKPMEVAWKNIRIKEMK